MYHFWPRCLGHKHVPAGVLFLYDTHCWHLHNTCVHTKWSCREKPVLAQVRIWNVVRSQQEIIDHMRRVDGIAGQPGLAALYSFDDPKM